MNFMSNDTDAPPLALSNEAAQPVRNPQPESGVDAALGDAFTSQGRSNTVRFVGEFESAFATYLARRGLVTVGDFEETQAIATIRAIEATAPRDLWWTGTHFNSSWTPMLANDAERTQGG